MMEIVLIGTFITLVIELDRARQMIFHRVSAGIWFSSFFVSLVVQAIQRRITLSIFVEHRTRMVVQNRAPFMHYCYFMMFTAMTRALTSYVLRTLKLLFRYPIFSIRVDRNAETWGVRHGDAGFAAYCGMVRLNLLYMVFMIFHCDPMQFKKILAEHEYNNPIVLAFVRTLLDDNYVRSKVQTGVLCRRHQLKENDFELELLHASKLFKHNTQRNRSQRRAVTRWFLAITLINNPVLRRTRISSYQNNHFISLP
jgi:hypothetical protein